MQANSRIFDDLARVAGGALGTLAGVKGEVETLFRQQFERVLERMEVVGRDEFEAVKAMAAAARAGQEALAERVTALEAEIVALKTSAPPVAAPGDPA
jgi:BMFP domain-containing protein YqiC